MSLHDAAKDIARQVAAEIDWNEVVERDLGHESGPIRATRGEWLRFDRDVAILGTGIMAPGLNGLWVHKPAQEVLLGELVEHEPKQRPRWFEVAKTA